MIIAIAAKGPDLDAKIEDRLGMAGYLLIVDLGTLEYYTIEIPFKQGGPGLGIKIVTLALEKGVDAIVTGFVSPRLEDTIKKEGIKIITCRDCSAKEFIDAYQKGKVDELTHDGPDSRPAGSRISAIGPVMKQTALQFFNMVPILTGVILIIGLMRSFVRSEGLMALFKGNPVSDTALGALTGSVFTGMPLNSYLIGDTLLKMGISPFAVTALLMTWVSVGLAQLPAEIAALGRSFGLKRIILSFIVSVIMTLIMGTLLHYWK